MRVCMYCSVCVTNCLCLCQFHMHCCLGSWRIWCFHSGPLWPSLCKRVYNVIMSGGEELLWQGIINRQIDACHANMTHLTHHVTAYVIAHTCVMIPVVKWAHTKKRGGHQCVNMHTLYVCSLYITPCVENDSLFQGYDPFPMLFVFRVTSCPLTPDLWPLTTVRQPADTSTELTAPKAHWPPKQRDRERETELWLLTFLQGSAVYTQLEWQFTCPKGSRREGKQKTDLIYEI